MKTFLVVNPHSANGSTGKHWPEISSEVGKTLGTFGHAFTRGQMDAAELTRKALRDGYGCIVAVGGDGTVNEVVNGFFENGKPITDGACFGVIPRGTGGDFRKAFGWDGALKSALERLRGEATQPFDVGHLEYVGHDGKVHHRYFANICSLGVSGLVDKEVNQSSKALGGKLSFMLGSVKALLKYSDRPVKFRCDDTPFQQATVTAIAVANGRYFGGGMMVAPDADTSDGLFDITIWSGYTIMDFAIKSKAIYDGSHVKFPGTRTLQCRTFEADSVDGSEVLLDVDGEQPGKLPCKMEVLPGAIRLKVASAAAKMIA